jgi:hypothetical protein
MNGALSGSQSMFLGRNALRPYSSSRSLTISRVGMPSTPAFSIEKEATQLAKFTAALGSLF